MGIWHGDLCGEQIAVSEDGQLTIIDQTILNNNKNNVYWRVMNQGGYVAPELLNNVWNYGKTNNNNNISQIVEDPFKADVFSLGMTLLFMTSLVDPNKAVYFADHSLYVPKI